MKKACLLNSVKYFCSQEGNVIRDLTKKKLSKSNFGDPELDLDLMIPIYWHCKAQSVSQVMFEAPVKLLTHDILIKDYEINYWS